MGESIIDTKPFSVEYKGHTLQVTVHMIGHNTIYFVRFPDNTPDLKLFRANGMDNPKFWTSIPEDLPRAKESEAIGHLIFAHYNPPQ